MFSQITQYRDDPIESFQARLMASNNPDKLDLGLGVYRNEQGEVVVFEAVIQAEQRLVAQRGHKGYRSPLGNRLYVEQMERLLFGDLLDARRIQGVVSAQTPGAGAACRVAAEYVKSLSPNSRVWVSLPKGMFSCLPVSARQQAYMETERGVFMLPGARMNFAALAQSNVERVARAFLEARALSSAAVA